MLAHVGDDEGAPFGDAPDIVDHMRGIEMPVVRQVLDVAHRRVALELGDAREPRRAIDVRDAGHPVAKDRPDFARHGGIDRHVLVELGGVDVDVDLLRVQRVGFQVAGDAVVEPHAERDEQVGLLNRGIDPGFAVHAHHAEVQRMRGRTPADAEQRHRNGNVRLLGERQKRRLRAAEDDAVAGENQRTLGGVDQRDRIDAHRVPGPGQRRQIRRGGVPVELAWCRAARPS